MQILFRVMAALRFRGSFLFARMPSLPNWIGENEYSFSSLPAFLEDLARFAYRLPWAALLDTDTLARFLFNGTSVDPSVKKVCAYYGGYHFV